MALLISPPATALAAHREPVVLEPKRVDHPDLRWLCALLVHPDSAHLLMFNHMENLKLICEDLTFREFDEYPLWSKMNVAAIGLYGELYPEEGPIVCVNCGSGWNGESTMGGRLLRLCKHCKGVRGNKTCWSLDYAVRHNIARAMFIPEAELDLFLANAIATREELEDDKNQQS